MTPPQGNKGEGMMIEQIAREVLEYADRLIDYDSASSISVYSTNLKLICQSYLAVVAENSKLKSKIEELESKLDYEYYNSMGEDR